MDLETDKRKGLSEQRWEEMTLIGETAQEDTLDKRLSHLPSNECAALAALVHRLRQRYGDDLLWVVLFGSKVRGDSDEESDIDVLVVVRMPNDDYWQHRRRLSAIAGDLDLEYDVILSTLLMDEPEFTEMRRANLLLNRSIQHDGIELWTSRQSVPTLVSA
jgi:predicted nucleotidyltransferase